MFEGKPFSVRDRILRQPQVWPHLWNPFRPSWGEPYKAGGGADDGRGARRPRGRAATRR